MACDASDQRHRDRWGTTETKGAHVETYDDTQPNWRDAADADDDGTRAAGMNFQA